MQTPCQSRPGPQTLPKGLSLLQRVQEPCLLREKGLRKRQEIKKSMEVEGEQGTTLESSKVGEGDVSTALLYIGSKWPNHQPGSTTTEIALFQVAAAWGTFTWLETENHCKVIVAEENGHMFQIVLYLKISFPFLMSEKSINPSCCSHHRHFGANVVSARNPTPICSH